MGRDTRRPGDAALQVAPGGGIVSAESLEVFVWQALCLVLMFVESEVSVMLRRQTGAGWGFDVSSHRLGINERLVTA